MIVWSIKSQNMCVCACLGRAAVDPVGVRVRREAACRVLVRGDVQRVSLRNTTRRERLSTNRRERRERRSVRLEGQTHTNKHTVRLCKQSIHLLILLQHIMQRESYPVIVGGVSQREAFNLQDEDAVVELDEVTTFLLP